MNTKNVLKGFIFIGLSVSVASLVGCGNPQDKVSKMQNEMHKTVGEVQQAIEQGKDGVKKGVKVAEKGQDIVKNVKEAITKGVAMKCTVKDVPKGGSWITYIKGKNIKNEGLTPDGHKMVSVTKNKVTYVWDKNTKQGQKIDQECMKKVGKKMGMNQDKNKTQFGVTEDMLNSDKEMAKLECHPVSGVDFSIPSDVKFIDTCAQMSDMVDMANKMQKQLPKMGQ